MLELPACTVGIGVGCKVGLMVGCSGRRPCRVSDSCDTVLGKVLEVPACRDEGCKVGPVVAGGPVDPEGGPAVGPVVGMERGAVSDWTVSVCSVLRGVGCKVGAAAAGGKLGPEVGLDVGVVGLLGMKIFNGSNCSTPVGRGVGCKVVPAEEALASAAAGEAAGSEVDSDVGVFVLAGTKIVKVSYSVSPVVVGEERPGLLGTGMLGTGVDGLGVHSFRADSSKADVSATTTEGFLGSRTAP